MKFRSRTDYSGAVREDRNFPEILPQYGYDVDKETGRKIVVKTGETNAYLLKQDALPETLIYNTIDRINRTGDMSLIDATVEGFIDVTSMPKSLMEAENVRIKAHQLFDQLPLETRKQYDNDIGKFLMSINSQLLAKAAAPAVDRSKIIDEVKSDESK